LRLPNYEKVLAGQRLQIGLWCCVLAAWGLLLWLDLRGIHSPFDHDYLLNASHLPWDLAFLLFFASWPLMVMAMMVPSLLLMPARIRMVLPLTTVLAYLAAWQIFGGLLFAGDMLLHLLMRNWLWLSLHARYVLCTLLLLTGLYQLSHFKTRSLLHCETLQVVDGAWKEGWRYGRACVGSCWPAMLVMFASGGRMLLVMSALTLLTLLEKNLSETRWLRTLSGVLFLFWGLLLWLVF
jgi:predicted metal-binding membrane protein